MWKLYFLTTALSEPILFSPAKSSTTKNDCSVQPFFLSLNELSFIISKQIVYLSTAPFNSLWPTILKNVNYLENLPVSFNRHPYTLFRFSQFLDFNLLFARANYSPLYL